MENGEEVVIGRAGKPVASLKAVEVKPKKRVLGLANGQGWMADDFDVWPKEEARALGIID